MKNEKEKSEQPKKTILLVCGDKGGVGKSTLARALAEYLEREKVGFVAYDGDDANPTYMRFFPEAQRIHTKSVKGFEPLINSLESDVPCQLADLGAGTSIMLAQFADHSGFVDIAREMGARVVFVFVLAPSADSINLLRILAAQYGNRVSYVIVRSEAIPGTWSLWQESKTRAQCTSEYGAVELSVPALDAEAFSLADRYDLRWTVATEDKRLPLACRSYVYRWLGKVFAEFDRAKKTLLP